MPYAHLANGGSERLCDWEFRTHAFWSGTVHITECNGGDVFSRGWVTRKQAEALFTWLRKHGWQVTSKHSAQLEDHQFVRVSPDKLPRFVRALQGFTLGREGSQNV